MTHILDPNREVDPAYVQYQLQTTDGEVLSGLLTADLTTAVTLRGVNLEQTIPRSRIKQMTSAGLSLMPEGLDLGLSLQEMANLLSFLIEARYDLGTSGRSAARDVAE